MTLQLPRRWGRPIGFAAATQAAGWMVAGVTAWALPLSLALPLLAGAAQAQPAAPAKAAQAPATASTSRKVLHIAFESAETTFDPAKISDIYSRVVTSHIFEALYNYDHLARPAKFVPSVADGMPVVTNNFKTWTIKLKPGILFADDPAFKGQRREVVAQDFVYAFERCADPANKSPLWGTLESAKIVGLAEKRKASIDTKSKYGYEQPLEGLKALDRHTIQFNLRDPAPRFIETLAQPDLYGAVAHEVVAMYGDQIGEHPVGTGPFKLKQWRRSSEIVLERNPTYRHVTYDAQPAADDAEGQAILAKFKGKKLPMVDEVRVAVIEETQPRWLSFLNNDLDALASIAGQVPGEFVSQGMPNGKVAPNLAKRGIVGKPQVAADSTLLMYNMEDPVVGGYTPDKVALRRALNLANDIDSEIRLVRRNQAIPSQSPLVPHTTGYDPKFKSEMGEFSPAKARALLDLYGYVDKDGDGWRDLPDGSPLILVRGTQPEQIYRQFNEQYTKDMNRIGVRVRYETAQWAEHLKQARAGKLQLWMLGSSAASPDGQTAFQRVHGPQSAGQNLSRFKLPAFDAIYDKMSQLPDGPERDDLFLQAKLLIVAYAPYKYHTHRIRTDMWHPWFQGYRRPLFWLDWWHMVDVDVEQRNKVVRR